MTQSVPTPSWPTASLTRPTHIKLNVSIRLATIAKKAEGITTKNYVLGLKPQVDILFARESTEMYTAY